MQRASLPAAALIVALTLSPAQAAPVSFQRVSGDFLADFSPIAVATGDVDGDGKLDIVVANNDADNVSVLWGDGKGSFLDTGAPIDGGVAPFGIALGDFNGDHKLDIVTSDEIGNTVTVLLNQGNRAFAAAISTDTGESPQGIAVADFDGDGFADVATANSFDGTVTILFGVGDGTLFIAQTLQAGDGGDPEPVGLALADLDGDLKPDLVVANSSGGPDGDGTIAILKGVDNGLFEAQPEIPLPADCGVPGCVPIAVAVAKLNADANPDIVVANEDGDTVSVFLGNGDLTFQAGRSTSVLSIPESVVTADFDGDGRVDIATSSFFDNKVSVLVGNGDGTFKPSVDFDVGTSPYGIATADFNVDGKPDIVAANVDDETVSVLTNTTATGVGDCNQDGRVTVDEVITMVSIALQESPVSSCTAGDANGDEVITVDEVVAAVNTALNG
jgi:FG-GAP-like repeat